MKAAPSKPRTSSPTISNATRQIEVQGAIQGVGFRPFVHALATKLNLTGWVSNTCSGAAIVVSGVESTLDRFVASLQLDLPHPGHIEVLSMRALAPVFFEGFAIRDSDTGGTLRAPLLPELVTCPECLREINNARDRRFGYAFTNCTHCGPRYTITEALPYDRPSTVMREFAMCANCQREYDSPTDRRFHAQPIACPVCGPLVSMRNVSGHFNAQSFTDVGRAIAQGAIVALKGLGGYQLVCDPYDAEAVARLRVFKARARKPFALMCRGVSDCERLAVLTQEERDALASSSGPIVISALRDDSDGLHDVTGGLPSIGLILPTTPLHHLLMSECSDPVICTSANRGEEPLIYRDEDAARQLGTIADVIVTHNRPIAAHADDSVVRVIAGTVTTIRAARGLAPTYIATEQHGATVLAVGTHLKNASAIAFDDQIILGPHVGTQDRLAANERTVDVCRHLLAVYQRQAEIVACDMHPDYAPTRYAHELGLPVIAVAHHHAHIAAVMAEHQVEGPVLGFAWDGTGYGTDRTIWGSEALVCTDSDFQRAATLDAIPLLGGEEAVRDGRRIALALLWEAFPERRSHVEFLAVRSRFDARMTGQLCRLLDTSTSVVRSHGMGRLFDGISAMLGVCLTSDYEGEAAARLEWAAEKTDDAYEIVSPKRGIAHDWRPMIRAIVSDIERNVSSAEIAGRFHNALANWALAIAGQHPELAICLGGGCFQNKRLTEEIGRLLRAEGRQVYRGVRIPANDGGVAVGQAFVARARAKRGGEDVSGGSR